MAKLGLANAKVEIDGFPIYIRPNSLKYTDGRGEVTVRTQSAGDNVTEAVFTDNAELKISMVSFEMQNTVENLRKVTRDWRNTNFHTIRIYDTGFTGTFQNMMLSNDPEYEVTADGGISLEWKGDPGIFS